MASEAGKGSTQRSSQVPDEVVAQNWQNIFGTKSCEYEGAPEEVEVALEGESPQE